MVIHGKGGRFVDDNVVPCSSLNILDHVGLNDLGTLGEVKRTMSLLLSSSKPLKRFREIRFANDGGHDDG